MRQQRASHPPNDVACNGGNFQLGRSSILRKLHDLNSLAAKPHRPLSAGGTHDRLFRRRQRTWSQCKTLEKPQRHPGSEAPNELVRRRHCVQARTRARGNSHFDRRLRTVADTRVTSFARTHRAKHLPFKLPCVQQLAFSRKRLARHTWDAIAAAMPKSAYGDDQSCTPQLRAPLHPAAASDAQAIQHLQFLSPADRLHQRLDCALSVARLPCALDQ